MMSRKERRAAEHAARKAARKAGFPTPSTMAAPPPVVDSASEANAAVEPGSEAAAVPPQREISPEQLAANRANAKLSTGPKTEAGRAKSSHNAVKTALTGRTVLLHTDDVAAYQKLGQTFVDDHKPTTPEEERLVQSLIDAEWRLMRIPSLEAGVYAAGYEELAGEFSKDLLPARVYLKYERTLRNLGLQEHRIRRHREKDLQALKELRAARLEREALLRKMQQAKEKAAPQPPSPIPATNDGFVFETSEIAVEPAFKSAA